MLTGGDTALAAPQVRDIELDDHAGATYNVSAYLLTLIGMVLKLEDTRNRILKAALELFSTHGYTAATTRQIAGLAGVTEVTLFRHFPAKEKLFEEVVCNSLSSPLFAQFVAQAKSLGYPQALLAIAEFFLEGLRQNEDLIKILYMESQRHSELMERIYVALVDSSSTILADYFAELQEKQIVRKFNARAAASMFLGIWLGFYEEQHLFAVDSGKEPPEEFVHDCLEIFVRGTQV